MRINEYDESEVNGSGSDQAIAQHDTTERSSNWHSTINTQGQLMLRGGFQAKCV